ncbi:hypothetical protein Tco_1053462, partial [Tanacetum coccineum]
IMAASTIAISSDSSDESVGSPPSRVILFGDIPTVIPSTSVIMTASAIVISFDSSDSTIAPVISSVAPVVETTLVASPTRLCGLVPNSGSNSDSPDEMSSPEHISSLQAISPFLCIDSFEAPDSSDGPPLQDPYVATIFRWRSRVTTHPSSSNEFPIAPVTGLPGIRRRSTMSHPQISLQRKTGFGFVTSWREEDLIREIDLYMPIYQCRLHMYRNIEHLRKTLLKVST